MTTPNSKPIEHVRASQIAAETAMSAVISYLKETPQPTSEEAHEIIDTILSEAGYTSPEGHIVASGAQSHEPHEKGTGIIKPGEAIVIDIYPQSKETGYWGDISRTVCIGEPAKELQHMYDTVETAMKVAFALIKPGTACADIHNAVADFFFEEGYETSGKGKEFAFAEGFVHAIGHGVGTEIHARPTLSSKSTDILKESDIVTIEPGLYYKHIGGVRIEDLVVVTKDGFQNLTTFPKQLVI